MKTIFLSFTPEPFYKPMQEGKKRFEYRSRFSECECRAYLYLSSPVQKVVARIKFGQRIELEVWKRQFGHDVEAMKRLKECEDRGKKYAIPILEFQEITPVPLNVIQEIYPQFKPPRSYCILNNEPTLLEYLDKVEALGNGFIHQLDCIESDEVCIC